VEAWFAEHGEVIVASGSSAAALSSLLDALKQIVARMTAAATEQTTQTGQATLAARDEATLRRDVRSLHLMAIVRVAGALRGKIPGMGVFKLPPPRLSSEMLSYAAEAIRVTAALYEDVFVEHGLPADFLDQLDQARAALAASVDARGVSRSRVRGASSGLADDLALGRRIVTMIDASLAHTLKSDAPTLASWRQAKRATVKGTAARDAAGAVPSVSGAVSLEASALPLASIAQSTAVNSISGAAHADTKAA
jgi:hypothetical protein